VTATRSVSDGCDQSRGTISTVGEGGDSTRGQHSQRSDAAVRYRMMSLLGLPFPHYVDNLLSEVGSTGQNPQQPMDL
jgi:hypothetical protein